MPVDVRRITCTQCASPLDVRNIRRSKTIVCGTCGSQLDLTDPNLAILTTLDTSKHAPRTPIRPGMTGTFASETWQVIGRIRYEEEGAIWDEFLMMSEVGEFLWLTEGEEGFTLYDPIVPKEPIDPNTVRDVLRIDNKAVPVRARGEGRVTFIEGEMTWRATVGDRVRYLDAQLGRVKYAIEWTPREIEYFRGEKQTAAEVRAAFGLPAPSRTPAPVGARATSGGGVSVSTIIILVVVACIVFACIVGALADTGDDDGPSGFSAGPVFVPLPSGGGGSGTGVSRGSSGGTRSGGGSSSRSSGGGK